MKIVASLGLFAFVVFPAATATAVSRTAPSRPTGTESAAFASYDGTTIDLRVGWGTAAACFTDGTVTRCFDSEAAMDAAVGSTANVATSSAANALLGGVPAALSTCASSVRLYSGTSYTGSVLQVATRLTFVSLSTFGFDNLTSSYKVGACSSSFYDGAAGTGSVYPGSTGAGAQFPSMVTGWSDRLGSVYLF
ncbi:MAG: hypothetical protein RLZZ623_527 [Actinomycetota bacterium]|jgi:hypothetical protein